MTISGRHIRKGARVIVDGRRVSGTVSPGENETVKIELTALPSVGMHLLQVQNPGGLFSNDFIFHVVEDAAAAEALSRRLARERAPRGESLRDAVASGNLGRVKRRLSAGADVNGRHPGDGTLPLNTAAVYGYSEITAFLIKKGAKVSGTNRDGNTPLHSAAFLCRHEVIGLLLEHGASLSARNDNGQTPVNVVSGPWDKGLADFYDSIGTAIGRSLDLERMQRDRPQVTKMLRKRSSKSDR